LAGVPKIVWIEYIAFATEVKVVVWVVPHNGKG